MQLLTFIFHYAMYDSLPRQPRVRDMADAVTVTFCLHAFPLEPPRDLTWLPWFSCVCSVSDVDTGLKDAMDVSADANGFLRTFPLQALLSAQSPRDVASALPPIFSHFLQKLKISPVRRGICCVFAR